PGRILVVDDEPLLRESLQRTFAADGHTVLTAVNGREGLVLYEKDRFDLVVLDYDMPDVKGDELALIIKALAPHHPFIIITASPDTLAANLLTEVDLVLAKPFDPQELRTAARKLMSG